MPGAGGGTPSKPSDLKPRVFSAIVLALAALGSAWWGGWVFSLVWGMVAVAIIHEWYSVASGVEDATGIVDFMRNGKVERTWLHWATWASEFMVIGLVPLGLFSQARTPNFFENSIWIILALALIYKARDDWSGRLWLASGLVYVGGLLFSLMLLRNGTKFGFESILFLFFVVWGADVGAYFAGRTVGGPKLAPAISPNKTWSGLIGGLTTASLAGCAMLALLGVSLHPMHLVLAILLALASAMGDLFESFFKRRFGVKDSSNLIPGHGGFMDRLDAFIFAAILAAIIGVARGGFDDAGSGLLTGW